MKNPLMTMLARVVFFVTGIVLFSGCYGLAINQMGMHYQTEKVADLDSRSFKKIGVYAVADGKTKSIVGTPSAMYNSLLVLPFYMVPFPYAVMTLSRAHTTDMYGFTPSDYPDKIEIPFKVKTDSSNAGPSFELALAMQKKLVERGYEAEAATDAPHKGYVSSDAMLSHAKNAGYDAAFVMVYTLFNRWQRFGGSETITGFNSRTTVINIKYTEGYLFVPSAALVDVQTGKILWSSAYYGLVSNASTPNLANQAFSIAVNDVIIESGRDTYVEAAKVTAERLFNPKHWKGSYKAFPAPKQRKEGEKFDF
jgi:hypothetical protein